MKSCMETFAMTLAMRPELMSWVWVDHARNSKIESVMIKGKRMEEG